MVIFVSGDLAGDVARKYAVVDPAIPPPIMTIFLGLGFDILLVESRAMPESTGVGLNRGLIVNDAQSSGMLRVMIVVGRPPPNLMSRFWIRHKW